MQQRPDLTALETTILHAQKKCKRVEEALRDVTKEKNENEAKLPSIRKELASVEKSLEELKEKQRKANEESGFALDEEDIKEYSRLCVYYFSLSDNMVNWYKALTFEQYLFFPLITGKHKVSPKQSKNEKSSKSYHESSGRVKASCQH